MAGVDRISNVVKLDRGLYRIKLTTPKVETTGMVFSHFEFNPDWEGAHELRYACSDEALDAPQFYVQDLLKGSILKPPLDIITTPTAAQRYYSFPERKDGSNVIWISQFGESVRLYIKGRFPYSHGFLFNVNRVLAPPSMRTMGDKRYYKAGGFLFYRSSTSSTNWALYNVPQSGVYSTLLKTGTCRYTTGFYDNETYMIEIIKDSTEKQIVRICDTWEVPDVWDGVNGRYTDATDNTDTRVTPFIVWKAVTDNSGNTYPFCGTIGVYSNGVSTRTDRNCYVNEAWLRRAI
jgi:hypothetical protein